MWVVKIGGSLERSNSLRAWLEVVTGVGAGRVLVVPGGGSFAEAVRVCDRHWELPSRISHRMAIVAMEQFGLMLWGLNAGLEPASDEAAIRAIWAKGRTPVWMAASMCLAAESEIEASWRVTSDSLSAWLAGKLAMPLVLVKAAPVPSRTTGIGALTRAGLLDRGFCDYARDLECEIFCLGPGEHPKLAEALAQGKSPGKPLERF